MSNFSNAVELENFLTNANNLYRTGVVPKENDSDAMYFISDAEYDALIERLRVMNPDAELLSKLEEEVLSDDTYKHSEPMLSTQKLYPDENGDLTELNNWVASVQKVADDLGIELILKITPKLDGFAGSLENGVLATRGNGIVGNNITYILDKGVVNVGSTSGRGEIVVNKEYFDSNLSDSFAHPRNFMSSVLSVKTSNEKTDQALKDGAVMFLQYSALENAILCTPAELFKNFDTYKKEIKETTPALIDGYVIEAFSDDIKAEMGHNNKFHRWQAAFKEVGEAVDIIVESIDYQVGRTGILTPVINFAPTWISGASVQRTTGSSIRLMIERKIAVGSKLTIVRSGEVIPTIVGWSDNEDSTYEAPTCCPVCNSSLRQEKSELYCSNNKCVGRAAQQVSHAFKTLANSDGFGEKTIERIVTSGSATTFIDFLEMTHNDIRSVGFGEGENKVLMRAIDDVKTKPVDDNLVLASLGISGVGERDSKKILSVFPLHQVKDLVMVGTDGSLSLIPEFNMAGFGEIKKNSLANGLYENAINLQYLIDNLNIVETEIVNHEDIEENHYKGKNVVITGSFELDGVKINRKKMTELVISMGGSVQSAVNSKTNILIAGDKAGSKLANAEKLGTVEILSQENPLTIELMNKSK